MTEKTPMNIEYDENGDPIFWPAQGGYRHPELTFEEQTEVFYAAVSLLYQDALRAYLDHCVTHNIDVPISDIDGQKLAGPPDHLDITDPQQLAAVHYGRAQQARNTLFAFFAQLGMDDYARYTVVGFTGPIPDDASSLHE